MCNLSHLKKFLFCQLKWNILLQNFININKWWNFIYNLHEMMLLNNGMISIVPMNKFKTVCILSKRMMYFFIWTTHLSLSPRPFFCLLDQQRSSYCLSVVHLTFIYFKKNSIFAIEQSLDSSKRENTKWERKREK